MRPLRLRVENFRSFKGEHTFCFDRDVNLQGIVGEIGSGKSTVLDGICYALFAVTPTASRTEISRLIHVGQASARVALLFETTHGEQWEAVRSIGTGASHALYRIKEERAVKAISLKAEVDEKIEQLIGLDFHSFTRAVMLPQGQFANLLRAPQTEREAILRRVLGFEHIGRMRELAKERRAIHHGEWQRLESIVAAKGNLLQRLADTSAQLKQRRSQFKKVNAVVRKWNRTAEALPRAKYDLEEISKWLKPASALFGRMGEADVTGLDARHQALTSMTDSLRATLEDRQSEYDRAAGLMSSTEIARAEALENENARLRFNRDRFGERLSKHRAQLENVGEQVSAKLVAALAGTTGELEAAHRHAVETSASRLRETLEQGGTCPVCIQPVDHLPQMSDVKPGSGGKPVATLAAERGRLESEIQRIKESRRKLTASIEDSERLLAETEDRISGNSEEVTRLLGEGVTVGMIKDRLRGAERERNRARSEYQSHLNATRAVREEYERALSLRDRAAALLPGEDVSTLQGAAESLAAKIMERSGEQKLFRSRIAKLEEDSRKMREASGGYTPPQAEASLRTEIETLKNAEEWLQKETEAVAELKTAANAEKLGYEMYQALHSDLADHRLVRWLLDEERERLARAGSKYLRRLSNERYGIVTDGDDLMILDGDDTRYASTLSGGETFLASLALALGLGEMIGNSTYPVRCLFLDEGFGSLDSLHIEQAMSGVENLAVGDHLVVVVSHLSEVQDRLEHVIEMARDPDGSTRQLTA